MHTRSVGADTHSSDMPAGGLIALFLADKPGAATRRAYAADLRDFFRGDPQPEPVTTFLALGAPMLTLRLFSYKAELLARGASEATVNRRLSVVRSLLKFAHRLGLASCDGSGLIEGEKLRPTQTRTALDPGTLKRLVAAPGTKTVRGRRDTAIMRLLCENGLGRAELLALDVADFSLVDGCLRLRDRAAEGAEEAVPLSRGASQAIAAYLEAAGHGSDPTAPLFRSLDHRPGVGGERLTPDGLYFLVRQHGQCIGIDDLTPHRLRRSAVAAALDAPSIHMRRVMSQRSEVSRQLAEAHASRRAGR